MNNIKQNADLSFRTFNDNDYSLDMYDAYVFTIRLAILDADSSIKYVDLITSGQGYIRTKYIDTNISIQIPKYDSIIGVILITNTTYFGFAFPKPFVIDDDFDEQYGMCDYIESKYSKEYSEIMKCYYHGNNICSIIEVLYKASKMFKWNPFVLTEGAMTTKYGSLILSVSYDGYIYIPNKVSFRKLILIYKDTPYSYEFPFRLYIENVDNKYIDAISVSSFLSQIVDQLGRRFNWEKDSANTDGLSISYAGYKYKIPFIEPNNPIEKIKMILDGIFNKNNWIICMYY